MNYQQRVIAAYLKNLGYRQIADVPTDQWLDLGFLNVPTDKLLRAIQKALNEAWGCD